MRDILCTVIVLTILVFGSVFYESIHPTIEAQLPTTLKITKLTTGGDDTFDFTVTGPTSYNPSINTASGGSPTSITSYDNLGTFGSVANAVYYEFNQPSTFVSIPGLIGEGVIQNGTDIRTLPNGTEIPSGLSSGEIYLGLIPSTWDFIHLGGVGEDQVSINFWINGYVGTAVEPFDPEENFLLTNTDFNSPNEIIPGGIRVIVTTGTNVEIAETNLGFQIANHTVQDIIPVNNTQWHMVTITYDKSISGTGNQAGFICVDNNCNPLPISNSWEDPGIGICEFFLNGENENVTSCASTDLPLTIGGSEDHTAAGSVETTFKVDEVSIWNGHVLTLTEIENLYNGGLGQRVGSGNYELALQFLVGSWTFDDETANGVGGGSGGMGMDGPTPVDPGTYSIQETVPAGWNLTTATCVDGSSSFSVDSVSGIVIDPGDNIQCTFENAFVGSIPDTDSDGIYNEVDTLPTTFSDDFSDIPLGGTSSGTITTRGDQILTITEETNPSGVRIAADVSGGLLPAIVNACGGLSLITLSSGNEVVVTCGSVTIDVINGPVNVTFISSGETQATTSLTAGNSITFDQDKFSFVAPSTNTQTIIIDVEGTPITINPGDTNTSPPEVGTIIASQDPIQAGTLVTASAAFTDLGPLETHTAEWDWGDLTTSSGVVSENGLSGTVTGSHTYSTPGVYSVTLTVTDDTDDSGSSIFQFVVIYDPSGGFVTGGGWINSPEGAYVTEPLLVGKATFGFVSKYQTGANVPTGNTQFSFHVADLKFKSTEYDWLVVAGSNAKFKGTGTINGQGNYGFQLFGFDADINTNDSHLDDKFRIKIWDKNNGDVVVYDNELGQSEAAEPSTIIGGGSIVIHKE